MVIGKLSGATGDLAVKNMNQSFDEVDLVDHASWLASADTDKHALV
jgi:hypothetical protein